MELMVACRRHRNGCHLWCDIPMDGVQGRQPVGSSGRLPVSLWHAQLVHRLHRLSCLALTLQMARTLPPLGSCRHLLAHRRQLLATDADSPADPRLLGVVAVLVCVAVCHSGHHRQLRQTAGTLKRRNILFHCAEGVCYITGALFYSLHKKPFMHSVFHFFVLAGSICHIIAVWDVLMEYL